MSPQDAVITDLSLCAVLHNYICDEIEHMSTEVQLIWSRLWRKQRAARITGVLESALKYDAKYPATHLAAQQIRIQILQYLKSPTPKYEELEWLYHTVVDDAVAFLKGKTP